MYGGNIKPIKHNTFLNNNDIKSASETMKIPNTSRQLNKTKTFVERPLTGLQTQRAIPQFDLDG